MKERAKGIDVKRRTTRHERIVTLADFPSRLAKVIHPASRLVIDEHIAHQDAVLVCKVREPPVELCNVLAHGKLKRLFQRKILHRRLLRLVSGLRFKRFRLSIHLAARLNLIDRRNNVVCRIGIFAGRFRIADLNIFSILRRFKLQALKRFYRCAKGGIFTFETHERRIDGVLFVSARRKPTRQPGTKEQAERTLVYGKAFALQTVNGIPDKTVNSLDALERRVSRRIPAPYCSQTGKFHFVFGFSQLQTTRWPLI